MKLYLMRHGESESNVRDLFSGCRGDVRLTDRGIEQARELGEKLRGIKFDKIFASSLVRAQMTCEAALPGCEYVVDGRIREVDLGGLDGLSADAARALWPDFFERFHYPGDYSAIGGESREEVFARLRSFLSDLEGEDLGTVAVFTHAVTMRMLFNMVFDTCSSGKLLSTNCLIAVFKLEGGKLTLDAWNI